MQRPFVALCRDTLRKRTLPTTSIHTATLRRAQFSVLATHPLLFPTCAPKHASSPPHKFLSTQAVAATSEDGETDELPLFEDKENLNPQLKQALKRMGLERMTEIQAKTFDAAACGQDVMARARTGTGKTLAFLLPSLEKILQNPIKGQVNMLVLSPTRELAAQIAEETRQLTSAQGKNGISYQVMFGGASRKRDIERLTKRVPTILVATPGRLQDHFANTYIRDKRFSTLFHQTQVLVLDEMDRLLDMGFRNAVEDIISYLPLNRQTLLFSATLPPSVKSVIQRNLRNDFLTVDCIHDSDPTTHTNELVEQSHVVVQDDKLVVATVEILLNIMKDPSAKLIVFFPTTKTTQYFAQLFNHGLNKTVIELHSGKTQSYRTSASNRFREVKAGVLFTSDVSARGVDYKDVSHVIQVGMPDSRETYIHRLGRTARAGKKGQGILILSGIEKGFLRQLHGLDIAVDEEIQELVDGTPSDQVLEELNPVLESIRTGQNKTLLKSAEAAYRGMMGYYQGQLKRIGIKSPEKLVRFVNGFSVQTGVDKVPPLSARAARSMGLYGASGIYVKEGKAGGGGDSRKGRRGESPNGRNKSKRKKRDRVGSTNRRDSSYSDWLG